MRERKIIKRSMQFHFDLMMSSLRHLILTQLKIKCQCELITPYYNDE